MKLLTIKYKGKPAAAVLIRGAVYRLKAISAHLPDSVRELMASGPEKLRIVKDFVSAIAGGHLKAKPEQGLVELLAPVVDPGSCRDGYAFRQHVESARRNRGLEMLPAYDEYPVLYLTNHRTVQGPGEVRCLPDHFRGLDFELEVAVVIGKAGRNIRAAEADRYIAGLMIMNDVSARTLQMEEMLLSLGPCKGKDFATATGPWLVTLDELQGFEVSCKHGHTGKAWNLEMSCRVNGELLSAGNLSDMDWTFAELIERASYGCELLPGDIIGSGTVGTGCLLELNGTWKRERPDHVPRWLKAGDVVEMEVTGLGKLVNTMVAEKSEWSILGQKKALGYAG